jgi:hypothetical protein
MRWQMLIAASITLATLGCDGKHTVKGKVQFSDGTPLTAGMVVFEDERAATSGYGMLGPDGSFEITYDDPQDGLPPGLYRVAVRPPSPSALTDEQKKKMPPRAGIALKYLQPETSEIRVTIEGERTDLVIELERDTASSGTGRGRSRP